jgi:apolipoprotein N-acyltransferase
MLAALAGTIGLLASPPRQIPRWAPGCELALVTIIIVSTVVLRGRQHGALARGFDAGILRNLVRSNWLRVIAWSAAGLLALWMRNQTFEP